MSPGDRSRYNEHEKEQPCGVSSHHPLLQDSTTCLSNVTTGRIGPRSALPVTTTKSEQIIVFESAVTKITGNEDGFVSPSVVYPLILFPQRLMEILDDENNKEAIAWLPHGRAFMTYNKQTLQNVILPKFFHKQSKYSSFTRKLNRWGFVRVTRGPETGAYGHEFFQRGGHSLCNQMTCHIIGKKHIENIKDADTDPPSISSPEDAPMLAEPYHHGHEHYYHPSFQHPHIMLPPPYQTLQSNWPYPPNTYSYPPPPDPDNNRYYPNPSQTSDHHPAPEDHAPDHHTGPYYHPYDVYHYRAYYASYGEPLSSQEVRENLSEEEQNAHSLAMNQSASDLPVPRPDRVLRNPQSLMSVPMMSYHRQLDTYEPRRESDHETSHDHFRDAAEGYHSDSDEE